jgi:SMI1 / KNR4 family (SUKH-1)
MNETEWKHFLTDYNCELLSYEEIIEQLSPEQIKAGWLGYNGATEEEITAIEKRLTIKLPPSFRAFLKVSNGWRFPSVSIFDLLPTSKLAWFREQNQGWIDAYTTDELPPVSDEEYFVYGDKQDCVNFRREYLKTALQISELGDSAVVLLNPKIVTPEGEWETWFFANWLPGAQRYRSFEEWLTTERLACRKQFKALSKAKVKSFATAKKPRTVKKAAEAARNGQTEIALESLKAFVAKGDDSATAPLAEIYAFFGQWNKVITNAGCFIANPESFRGNYGDIFQNMVRLIGRAGHRTGEWERVIEVSKKAMQTNAEAGRNFYEKIFLNLIEYAKRKGGAPHELIAIYGKPKKENISQTENLVLEAARAVLAGPKTQLSQEQREAKYQNAIAMANTSPFLKPHLKTIHAKMEYVFDQIKNFWEDKALELYATHGANFTMAWEAALYVTRAYIKRGDSNAAWTALQPNLSKWWPNGLIQVAPVILLTDDRLNTLMTPERCQFVLSTPRGPEALKK